MEKSSRHLLRSLEAGEHGAVMHPGQADKLVAQASRVGECYYLVGPLFADWSPTPLASYLLDALEEGDTAASAVRLLNDTLEDADMPPEARIFECTDLTDALYTLTGLVAAYD